MASSIKKILVPMDGSQNSYRGLDEAIRLAGAVNASITGLYVSPSSIPSPSPMTAGIRDNIKKAADSIMEGARRKTVQKGIKFQEKITSGNVGSAISTYADHNKFDIVVIGSRGLTGAKQVFLGSVANHVVHAAKASVLVVK